jgi:hypothetical protein
MYNNKGVRQVKEKGTIFPLRIENKMYEDLRKVSYLTHISKAELIRMGLESKLNEYKKMLIHTEINV